MNIEHKTIDSMLPWPEKQSSILKTILPEELEAISNGQITTNEVLNCIKSLKMASSKDLKSNGILKGLDI